MTKEEYIKSHVVHCKKAPYDVYCGRPKRGLPLNWGNQFEIGKDGTREEVIQKYIDNFSDRLRNRLPELKDKVLACWCEPLDCHCHFLAGEVWEVCYGNTDKNKI